MYPIFRIHVGRLYGIFTYIYPIKITQMQVNIPYMDGMVVLKVSHRSVPMFFFVRFDTPVITVQVEELPELKKKKNILRRYLGSLITNQ